MNEIMKRAFEEMFTRHCFSISENGEARTLAFLIKNDNIWPVLLADNMEIQIGKYVTVALKSAQENDSDAIILIGEQYMVTGKRDSDDIKKLLSGEIKASEHPDKKEYLVLSYMTAEGHTDLLFGEIKTSSGGTRYVVDQKWVYKATTSLLVPWR